MEGVYVLTKNSPTDSLLRGFCLQQRVVTFTFILSINLVDLSPFRACQLIEVRPVKSVFWLGLLTPVGLSWCDKKNCYITLKGIYCKFSGKNFKIRKRAFWKKKTVINIGRFFKKWPTLVFKQNRVLSY